MDENQPCYWYNDATELAEPYIIKRINTRTVRVQSTDRTKEFSISKEEFVQDWHFLASSAYNQHIKELTEEIKKLQEPIIPLQQKKRRLLRRL